MSKDTTIYMECNIDFVGQPPQKKGRKAIGNIYRKPSVGTVLIIVDAGKCEYVFMEAHRNECFEAAERKGWIRVQGNII